MTQLAGKQNQGALARSNAYLRRTDLVTELVGAVVFGWIYSKAGLVASMAFTAGARVGGKAGLMASLAFTAAAWAGGWLSGLGNFPEHAASGAFS